MDEGSYGGGFVLGFLLGIIGLIIAICIDKRATRKGAITGFFVSLGISVVCVICYFAVIAGMIAGM